MRQLLRRTRSTEGLYARVGEVEDGQLSLAIWCSERPEEEREYSYAAAESFVRSFKSFESQCKSERREDAEIKLEEGQRRNDRRCTTIKRERSRQIKKEVVEDEVNNAVTEPSNGGSRSERNVKRKRKESLTPRKKRCTVVKHTCKRSSVVEKEVVETVTGDGIVEERPKGVARIEGKRQTRTNTRLPVRTQPARQCRIKQEVVEQATDEPVAEDRNVRPRCKRKIKVKTEPVEEESALYDIAVHQYGEGDEDRNSGRIELEHGNGAGTASDERIMPEPQRAREGIIERAKDDHLIVVLRYRVKPLRDTTDTTSPIIAEDAGTSQSPLQDVALDLDPTKTARVHAIPEDIFIELVQEDNKSLDPESTQPVNAVTPPDAVAMVPSDQNTAPEPVFVGPCAELIEEYGSETYDLRYYEDGFVLSRRLSAALFNHSNAGHRNFEAYLQACNSILSEVLDDSGDDSGILPRHPSPELPQRQLRKLVIDSNQPLLPHESPKSLVAVDERDHETEVNMISERIPDSAIDIEPPCDHELITEHNHGRQSASISSTRKVESRSNGHEDSACEREPKPITHQELKKRLAAVKRRLEAKHPCIVEETKHHREQQQISLRVVPKPTAQKEDLHAVAAHDGRKERLVARTGQEQLLREMEQEEQMIFARKLRIGRAGYLDIAGHRFTSSKEAFKFCRKKQNEQRRKEKRKHRRRKYPGFC